MGPPNSAYPIRIKQADVFVDLMSTLGISLSPPMDQKEGEIILTQQAWEVFSAQFPNKALPTFESFYYKKFLDGDSTTLSKADLKAEVQKIKVENQFAKEHGYPAAIIEFPNSSEIKKEAVPDWPQRARYLYRMTDGSYFFRMEDGEISIDQFQVVTREIGAKVENTIARLVLTELERWYKLSVKYRSDLKRFPDRRMRKDSLVGERNLFHPHSLTTRFLSFGTQKYPMDNRYAAIAYHPESLEGKLLLSQNNNACVAVSIWNGALLQGKGLSREQEIVDRFHAKLAAMQHSSDGRLDIEQILHSKIPGLSGRRIKALEAASLVAAGKPVLAEVPYFGGHVFLIIGMEVENRIYKGIDTMSGMTVEERLPSQGYYTIEVGDVTTFLEWINTP